MKIYDEFYYMNLIKEYLDEHSKVPAIVVRSPVLRTEIRLRDRDERIGAIPVQH